MQAGYSALTRAILSGLNSKIESMRPYITLLLFLLLTCHAVFAQSVSSDTSGYERQRLKVNELLTQRSARFGQFDESLKKRTGIFGLKTKKDMQASIDILKQIVLTDNEIFKETKALLDYKEFEKEQVSQRATEFDSRINGYIRTISKLQQSHDQLTNEIAVLERRNQRYAGLALLFGTLVAAGAVCLIFRRQKLTKV